ncbi:hypothetical protein COO60DRAFT_1022990 [Scenedesmus sp. NREL 46B-D3]|nr:hypothetical protein COO60DRAFT_1022990 [Scenedesmus sp. NREL 46B-D3]
MDISRRQLLEASNRRAAEASAAAKASAQKFVQYTADCRAALELYKRHGLSGIVNKEEAHFRREQSSSRLTAVFKLDADGSDVSRGHRDQQQQPQPRDLRAVARDEVAGRAGAAGVLGAAVAAASTSTSPTPTPKPPPAAPPLPAGKVPAGGANTSSNGSSGGHARAGPAPPPPPPPLPATQSPGNQQLSPPQQQQQGTAVVARPPGVASPPLPAPLPTAGFNVPAAEAAAAAPAAAAGPRAPPLAPPLPPAAAAAQPPAATYSSAAAPAAAAAGGPRAPPPAPPLPGAATAAPPPGAAAANSSAAAAAAGGPRAPPPAPPLLPAAAAAQAPAATYSSAAAPAAAAAGGPRAPPPAPPLPGAATAAPRPGATAAANSSAAAAGGQQGPNKPPPPPPLPPASRANSSKGQLPAGAAATEGMHSLAAVATAAAAVAAAANGNGSSGDNAAAANSSSPCADAAAGAAGGSKLKRLHVDRLPGHKLPAGSFWRIAEPVTDEVTDSMEYLLRAMFSVEARRSSRSSPRHASEGYAPEAEGCAAEVVKCVNEKRALHVEVVLKRLRLPPAALAAAINLLSTAQLAPDDLASIRSILPKPEELQAVRDAKQDMEKKMAAAAGHSHSPRTPAAAGAAGAAAPATPGSLSPRLGIVEAAFDALGGVELLQAKMRAMEFRYDVDAVASAVAEYTADVARAFDALRSGSLQYLLAFVRDVADTMNRACNKGPLAGFKLEAWRDCRMSGSTDLNLLHYIVAHISEVLPRMLALDGERDALRAACRRGSFDAVYVRIRVLLETQKRLYADLARTKEQQQQQQQQQHSLAGMAAGEGPAQAGPCSRDGGGGTPRTTGAGHSSGAGSSSSSSSGGHDAYIARLSELLDSSAPKVAHLQQQLDGVVREFRWLAEYFCEDVKGHAWTQQPVSFLTHFLDLLDSVAATMKDAKRLERVAAMLKNYNEARQQQQQQQGWGSCGTGCAAGRLRE